MSDATQPLRPLDLDERSLEILDFERGWKGSRAAREQEIRERFGMSTPRYHQVLNQLLDDPAALAHDPLLVKRLRRLRERRQEARSATRLTR